MQACKSAYLFSVKERLSAPASHALAQATAKEPESTRRRRALRRVDKELQKGSYKTALSMMKQLQGKPGGLRGFGAVKLVPNRNFYAGGLDVNTADETLVGALVEAIMDSIKRSIKFAEIENTNDEEVLSSGADILSDGESFSSQLEDHLLCVQHEAGHFLVGYLLGVLPQRYTIPSQEDLKKDWLAGGNVEFPGFEFLQEVGIHNISDKNFTRRGHLSHSALSKFLCVVLGGLAAEHMLFGCSELLHSDVKKLDTVLKWMGFEEDEADLQIRWAAANTISILRHHTAARSRLAEAMALGKTVGFCMEAIERTL